MSNKAKIFLVAIIILAAAASRLVDHPYNFTPIVAMALFSGCYLKNKWSFLLPMLAMLISDIFIGFYEWQIMLAVYFCFALAFIIGRFLSQNIKWYNVIFASLTSSVIFFIVTNFAVWSFGGWYAYNLSGLTNCFIMALPFFRNSLAGDLFYSGLVFGLYSLVSVFVSERQLKKANNL